MAKFQGSGFSVDLPAPVFDSSSYIFAFPDAGDLASAITIRFDIVKDKPDLKEYAGQQRESLNQNLTNLEVVSEVHNKRGTWDYAVCVIEWGETECRMRQKQLYVFGRVRRIGYLHWSVQTWPTIFQNQKNILTR